jgi:tetratricopeptide (TPR) repeat protein
LRCSVFQLKEGISSASTGGLRVERAAWKRGRMTRPEDVQVAERLLAEGRSAEALKLAEAVLATVPGEVRALRLAARAASRLRAFEAAAGFWLEAAKERGGTDVASISSAAVCWLRARNFRSAFDTAGRALTIDPNDLASLEVKVAASEALRLRSDLVDAIKRLAGLDPDKAVDAVPRVLAAGDPIAAAEILSIAGLNEPKAQTCAKAVMAALEEVSKRAYRASDDVAVAGHLRAMLRLAPDHDPARRVLAKLVGPRMAAARQHLTDGALPAARRQLEGVLALDPDHAEALRALAGVAAREGAPQEAVRLVEQLAALAPADPAMQFALGQAYEADRQFAKAVDAVLRARSLGYAVERCERALHRLLRALRDVAREMHDTQPDESLALVEAILKADPANVAALRLAKTLSRNYLQNLRSVLQTDDVPEQYRLASLLSRAAPDNIAALKVMAKSSERLGLHAASAEALTKLIEAEGPTELNLVRLARSYKATRQFAAAVEAADKALAINPDSVAAQAIRNRILASPSFQREHGSSASV